MKRILFISAFVAFSLTANAQSREVGSDPAKSRAAEMIEQIARSRSTPMLIDRERSIDSVEQERRSEDSVRRLKMKLHRGPRIWHRPSLDPASPDIAKPPQLGMNLILRGTNFRPGSTRLALDDTSTLVHADSMLRLYPMIRISINGHTDNSEGLDQEERKELSYERAMYVREWLINHHIDPNRLETRGYGQDRPIATNRTPEGQHRNRRVEFQIIENTYKIDR
jgi:outer membrane protein OmpA-like peptidoglycan-associated protein